MKCLTRIASLIATTLCSVAPVATQDSIQALRSQLEQAGENRNEIERALTAVPADQARAMRFLVQHMPEQDLRRLSAKRLLEEVNLATTAWRSAPWGKRIPQELFMNDILPYANVSERRDPWRAEFRKQFLPLVKDCKSPGEAAQVLNREIFRRLGVKYSTRRRRADQSPKESAEIGMASCTGLSIILTNACRAIGVPARLAGIPNWVNKRGNHTWVEVWDDGWHFTGAAEPSSKGLNHTWFQKDAALAKADDPRHSIYAVSYRRTGTKFPMVWARRGPRVDGVNVTQRYAPKAERKVRAGHARLMVRVREFPGGPRVIANVELRSPNEADGESRSGRSRGEENDTNDFLTFDVKRRAKFVVRAERAGLYATAQVTVDGAQRVLDLTLLSSADLAFVRALEKVFAKRAARANGRTAVPGAVRKHFDADPVRGVLLTHRAFQAVQPKPNRPLALPTEFSWRTKQGERRRLWLGCPNAVAGDEFTCRLAGNRITITAPGKRSLVLYLGTRFIDFSRKVNVDVNGRKSRIQLQPNLETLCQALLRGEEHAVAYRLRD